MRAGSRELGLRCRHPVGRVALPTRRSARRSGRRAGRACLRLARPGPMGSYSASSSKIRLSCRRSRSRRRASSPNRRCHPPGCVPNRRRSALDIAQYPNFRSLNETSREGCPGSRRNRVCAPSRPRRRPPPATWVRTQARFSDRCWETRLVPPFGNASRPFRFGLAVRQVRASARPRSGGLQRS